MATVASILCLVGCMDTAELTDADQLDPDFFNLSGWVEQRAIELEGVPLTKTVVINGLEEMRTIEDVDWADELAPFAQSNIDRPALWDAYAVDTMSAAEGQVTVTYRAIDSSLFTKRVQVLYADGVLPLDSAFSIEVRNSFDSFVADTEQRLSIRPGHYTVVSRQAARLLEPRTLSISAAWEDNRLLENPAGL